MYKEAFESFLKNTDEKKIFLEVLTAYIKEKKCKSILDIGAGNGDLSIPLSKLVDTYLAIEPIGEQADIIRQNNIQVVQDFFPCNIDQNFDTVLCSHSTPGKPEKFIPFINNAFELCKPDGNLLIITYNDSEKTWNTMLEKCSLEWPGFHNDRLALLRKFLNQNYNNIDETEIITHISSTSYKEFIHALAFVYTDGKHSDEDFVNSKTVQQYITENHYINGVYSFPFYHYMFSIRKPL